MELIGVLIVKLRRNFLVTRFSMYQMSNVPNKQHSVWKKRLKAIPPGLPPMAPASQANFPWKKSPKSPSVNSSLIRRRLFDLVRLTKYQMSYHLDGFIDIIIVYKIGGTA
mgnify:CR=1 FL=1